MLSCACSLRSTQCAALIALATAAGISRFEPASGGANERATDTPTVTRAEGGQLSLRFFRAALTALAPWFPRLDPAVAASASIAPPACDQGHCDQGDDSGGGRHAAFPAASPSRSLPVLDLVASPSMPFPACAPGPSARNHSFPFAVGPPDARAANRRVAGTAVPGDSAARRRLVEEFAADSLVAACAARAPSPSPELDGPLSNPSFALRGKPELSPAFEPCGASCADANVRRFLS
jgi:hypothetical protein